MNSTDRPRIGLRWSDEGSFPAFSNQPQPSIAKQNISGSSGQDVLDGAAGDASLVGGEGDDIYLVDSINDEVVETSGQGRDIIVASVDYTLPNDVEELVAATGDADLKLTGNGLANFIIGNNGDNELNGGAGSDAMAGGGGDDLYIVDSSFDQIVERGNEGRDTVRASASYELGANLEDLLLTGDGDHQLLGNSQDNALVGNGGSNFLSGRGGQDSMSGGGGDDIYLIDADDSVTEEANAGIDTVFAAFSYTLPDNFEVLRLSGDGDVDGAGNAQVNLIVGTSGSNRLTGGADGGVDFLFGGAGDDVYEIDNSFELVIELAGEGADRIVSSASYQLRDNIEALELTGNANLVGIGNGLRNRITGNAGDNLLDGGTDQDSLIGGTGNDYYVIDSLDTVTEEAGEGTDTILIANNYQLLAHFEVLRLIGTGDFSGTGNAAINVIFGNAGNNALDGGGGGEADLMIGGSGNDTYQVDNSYELIVESADDGLDNVVSSVSFHLRDNVELLELTGTENLFGIGNAQDNIIFGNDGNNMLDGRGGLDILIGGSGNDFYFVDSVFEIVTEAVDQGIDIVVASGSFVLPGNVERLRLVDTAVFGTGNDLNNRIVGSSENNTLNGLDGVDTLTGGGGGDVFQFTFGQNNADLITDFDAGFDFVDFVGFAADARAAQNTATSWRISWTSDGGGVEVINFSSATAFAEIRILYDGNVKLFFDEV